VQELVRGRGQEPEPEVGALAGLIVVDGEMRKEVGDEEAQFVEDE
jgi:hypothetical protein